MTPITSLSLAASVGAVAVFVASCSDSNLESAPSPRLADVQRQVFAPACAIAGCHDKATRAGALDLSSLPASYSALVNRPAVNRIAKENGWLLVKPGEPELSFLYRKMDLPGVGEGAAMPVGDLAITEPYMDLVYAWIAEGAQP